MASEQTKGDREISVFSAFVKAANLPIELESVQKRLPPEPDLRCWHRDDGNLAFELVEICDPNLAQIFALPAKDVPAYIRTSDPSAGIIRKKLRRTYETDVPIELLMYTDGRVITPANVILPTVVPCLESYRSVFRRAWLYAEGRAYSAWEQ